MCPAYAFCTLFVKSTEENNICAWSGEQVVMSLRTAELVLLLLKHREIDCTLIFILKLQRMT